MSKPKEPSTKEIVLLQEVVHKFNILDKSSQRRLLTYLADRYLGAGIWTRHPIGIKRLSRLDLMKEKAQIAERLQEIDD